MNRNRRRCVDGSVLLLGDVVVWQRYGIILRENVIILKRYGIERIGIVLRWYGIVRDGIV